MLHLSSNITIITIKHNGFAISSQGSTMTQWFFINAFYTMKTGNQGFRTYQIVALRRRTLSGEIISQSQWRELFPFFDFGHDDMMGYDGAIQGAVIFEPERIWLIAFHFKVNIMLLKHYSLKSEKSGRIGDGAEIGVRFFKNLDSSEIHSGIDCGNTSGQNGLI